MEHLEAKNSWVRRIRKMREDPCRVQALYHWDQRRILSNKSRNSVPDENSRRKEIPEHNGGNASGRRLGWNGLAPLIRITVYSCLLCLTACGESRTNPGIAEKQRGQGSRLNIEDCRSMEECEVYYNTSDPLRDAILLNEEETFNRPCLVQGELKASSNWYGYLANGTLAANGARFYYKIVYPEDKCCIKLLLYLEEQVSALRAHMNCLQRQSIIATNPKQIITLSPSVESSGCTSNHTYGDQQMIECNSGRILRSAYDQHWLFAASSCGSPKGLNMQYTIIMYGMRTECPEDVSGAVGMRGFFVLSSISGLANFPSILAIYSIVYAVFFRIGAT